MSTGRGGATGGRKPSSRSNGRRHFGSVRRLPSGRWQASYWFDGRKHTAPSTFLAKADALAYLSTVETDLRRGTWIDSRAGDITLAEYADSWLGSRPTLRPRTVEIYRHLLDAHILPTLGKHPMSRLQPQAIRAWNAGIAGRLPSTAAKAYRLLATTCRSAVTDEVIVRSPCRLAGAGTEHAPERPTVSVAEVEVLTKAMPEHLQLVVPLAVWCSRRRGELLALRRQDVDVTAQTIRIERTMHQQSDGTIAYGPPKTSAGRRTVCYPTPSPRRSRSTSSDTSTTTQRPCCSAV